MKKVKRINFLEEYKELYYRENEYEEKLNSKSNVSLTLLTILGGGQILLWDEMFSATWNIIHIVYLILCGVTFFVFCRTIYLFLKAYHNYTYKRFPIKDTKECINISNEKSQSSRKIAENLNTYQEKLFVEQYISCAIFNREVNLKKNSAQKNLTKWLIILFCITIACFIVKTTLFKIYCPNNTTYQVEISRGDYMCDTEKDELPPIPQAEMVTESFAQYKPKPKPPQEANTPEIE